MDRILTRLATLVSESDDVENLVRPLLELLQSITGLDSTYVTTIDEHEGMQNILFAHNTDTRSLEIPEGMSVPWHDTLCRRALNDQRSYSEDVSRDWGDSNAARELGITTYVSEPIRIGEDEMYGTLCGASSREVRVQEDTRRLIGLFAQLIARQVERDQLLMRLRQENREYSHYAFSDPLTGIPNRRALVRELKRELANAERFGNRVHVAFLDLDGFKNINDRYGHDAGDRFLIQIAHALSEGMREGDFVARFGGDEFVMFGPANNEDFSGSRQAIEDRLSELTTGRFDIGTQLLDYDGPSVGVITTEPGEKDHEDILERADVAMYNVKKARKQELWHRLN